jgi:hypothetical protein
MCYFPVAGIEVQLWVPPLVAFAISLFTSMAGVSGAFLLLPFQVSYLGFTSPAVSATNHIYNIVAIPSGVYCYIKENRMVWPLTWVVVAGTLPGVFVGGMIRIKYLPDPATFKKFVAAILLYIGIRLLLDILKKSGRSVGGQVCGPVSSCHVTPLYLGYSFGGEEYRVSTILLLTLSLIVGVIGGAYGIGGGAIIAPLFVSFFRLPVHTVAGAALMGTLITSIAGVVFFQTIAPFYPEMSIAPDWRLGILFGAGGFAGMYCGARLQRFVPATIIKSILVVILIYTGLSYTGIL